MLNKIAIALWLGAVAIGCANTYEPPERFVIASTPYPRLAGNAVSDGWMLRFNAMCKEASEADQCKVVFLGDSITDGWNKNGKDVWQAEFGKYHAINWGIGSERTEHMLWRMENGQFQAALQPKAFVVMIGTNNIGQRNDTPEDTAAGVKAVIDCIRTKRPEAKVLLLGIFPRGKTLDDPKRIAVDATNTIIKNFDDGKHVVYMDIGKIFTNYDGSVDGKIMPDYLHLTPDGYQKWAASIAPKLKELVEKK